MKRKQVSEEQGIGILREADAGAVVTELCRRHGMSSATCLSVQGQGRRLGGRALSAIGPRTMASDARRLRALEDENGKLKRLLAGTMLDSEADRMTVPGACHPAARV